LVKSIVDFFWKSLHNQKEIMEVGIYGLGRFGTFWASELSRHCTVKVYSRTRRTDLPAGLTWVEEDELLSSPTVILCVSISAMEQVLAAIAGRLKPGVLVMDTCSVKVYPVLKMTEILPSHVEILGTHPMFGPDSGVNGIRGLPLVLSPVRIGEALLAAWHKLFVSMGLTVIRMDPHEHDREAAYTQGITHYVGRVLADLGLKESSIATLGYKKILEVMEQTCNDPWQLFLDLQRFNPYTEEMRRKLHDSLERIFSRLEGSLDMQKKE
jgi:prephenate dehydrogenase